jgi:ribosomal protein L11 methyltransferase
METYLTIDIACPPEYVQILIAELAELDFDTFEEKPEGLSTYALKGSFDEVEFNELINRYRELTDIEVAFAEVEKTNWNVDWEANYEPIIVEDKVLVRATFHEPQPQFPYEIIIQPKMSFGTGHHETTYLMLAAQLDIDHKGKNVLDAGCGTGILSIMAGILRAKQIVAYDNDAWVIDNVEENLRLNDQEALIFTGVLSDLNLNANFDIILANINKNVLQDEMENFSNHLLPNGNLLLSGFYEEDLEDLKKAAMEHGLKFVSTMSRNGWALGRFQKN